MRMVMPWMCSHALHVFADIPLQLAWLLQNMHLLRPLCMFERAGTPPEQHVLPYLVEDRGPGTPSYQDFAAMLHRAVLSKS